MPAWDPAALRADRTLSRRERRLMECANPGDKGRKSFEQIAAPQGRHVMYSNAIAKHNTALSGAKPFLYAKTAALCGAKPLSMTGTGESAKQILMMTLCSGNCLVDL